MGLLFLRVDLCGGSYLHKTTFIIHNLEAPLSIWFLVERRLQDNTEITFP